MKILFLSSWFPYPTINGAKIRIYNLIRQLAQSHEITLVSFAKTIPINEARKQIPWLQQYCREVDVVPYPPYVSNSLAAYRGFLSTKPRSVVHAYSPDMARLINEKVEAGTYDVVVASEVNAPSVTSLLATRIKGVPIVLDALEVGLDKDAYASQTSSLNRFRSGLQRRRRSGQ